MQEKEENKQNQMKKEKKEGGKIREKEKWIKKREHSEHFIPRVGCSLLFILPFCLIALGPILFSAYSALFQQASKRYLEQRDPAF